MSYRAPGRARLLVAGDLQFKPRFSLEPECLTERIPGTPRLVSLDVDVSAVLPFAKVIATLESFQSSVLRSELDGGTVLDV